MSANDHKANQFKLQSIIHLIVDPHEDHARNCMNNTVYCIHHRSVVIVYILLWFEMREKVLKQYMHCTHEYIYITNRALEREL